MIIKEGSLCGVILVVFCFGLGMSEDIGNIYTINTDFQDEFMPNQSNYETILTTNYVLDTYLRPRKLNDDQKEEDIKGFKITSDGVLEEEYNDINLSTIHTTYTFKPPSEGREPWEFSSISECHSYHHEKLSHKILVPPLGKY